MMMEQRDAEQGQREQDEINGHSQDQDRFDHWGLDIGCGSIRNYKSVLQPILLRLRFCGLLRMRFNTSPAASATRRSLRF